MSDPIPGQEFVDTQCWMVGYTRTVIDEKASERMFYTEDEAKAVGWRAPRG